MEEDLHLVAAAEKALTESGVLIDRFFFDWMGRPQLDDPAYAGEAFADFRTRAAAYEPARARTHAYWSGEPCSMHIEEVEAIWARIAEDDDWAPLTAKVAAIRAMGEAYRD